jgi:hypothetical protein
LLCISFITIISCKKVEKPAEAPIAPATEVKGADDHFQKAHNFFLKKDFKAVAAEIRNAAELLKQEAEKATIEGKKALTASINDWKNWQKM